jgi:uncharacterized protein
MSSPRLSNKEALSILRGYCSDERVLGHCVAVSRVAAKIAGDAVSRGHAVDVGFVESAALLHDIGRSQTHGIDHGIAGAKILEDYPDYARVCLTHIGAGITRGEAEKAGLPPGDYIPKTVEEKIIAHADNLVDGERTRTLEEAAREFALKLGADHPSVGRVRRLGREIEKLAGK